MDVTHAILFSKEIDILRIPVDCWSVKFELIRGKGKDRVLLQFSVSNFRSIKDEVVLSMLANENDDEHTEWLCSVGAERLIPVAAIYGANAAGKSNILIAMAVAIKLIRYSDLRGINNTLPDVVPFLFDEEMHMQPTRFDFIFIYKGKKYQYGFSADKYRVMEEYLYAYESLEVRKIFERKDMNQYSFPEDDEKRFNEYAEKNTSNKLFLATATSWNCAETKEPYMWFAEAIDVYNFERIRSEGLNIIEEADQSLKDFLMKTLKDSDFNISDYTFEDVPWTLAEFRQSGMSDVAAESLKRQMLEDGGKRYRITARHAIRTKAGNQYFDLPLQEESAGTEQMFFGAALIKRAMESEKTIIVDELSAGLHPLLLQAIIKMFYDKDLNQTNAQLIFSTHDISLFNLDLFRRDQIYFVEKENSTGISTLYSLDEFSPAPVREDNVRESYLQGRYGAIPIISLEDTIW